MALLPYSNKALAHTKQIQCAAKLTESRLKEKLTKKRTSPIQRLVCLLNIVKPWTQTQPRSGR